MVTPLLFVLCIVVAYLVGSICSAVIVCRLFDLPDPRTTGSQNPGATNVLRVAGKQYAAIVLLADMLKGFLPVLFAWLIGANDIILGFTCFAAVLGHMYPVFFGFKGGKGVATALGALLGIHLMLGVVVIATWLLVANFTRYSSLASIVSIACSPFYSLFIMGNLDVFLPILFTALFILFQHRDNITRLIDGNEEKINFKHPKPVKILAETDKTTQSTVSSEPQKAPKAATPKTRKTTKVDKADKAGKVEKTSKANKAEKTDKTSVKKTKTAATTKPKPKKTKAPAIKKPV